MLLCELFADSSDYIEKMRASLMPTLIPLAAHKVGYVTIQSIMDKMRKKHTGMVIDRNLVMDVLDPQKVKLVDRIEGDRIYLSFPEENLRKVTDDQTELDAERVEDAAQKQAMKAIKER